MVIIIQDPVFFLSYVIVHCNFTCSVGVTHSQELKQSANYKDGISPHLLSLNYFLPSPGLSPHNRGTFLLTSSLRAICVGGEEVDGEVQRGRLPCSRVQKCRQCRSRSGRGSLQPLAQAAGLRAGAERQGIWPSTLFLSHQDPSLHITLSKCFTTLSFPPSHFNFLNLSSSCTLLHSV